MASTIKSTDLDFTNIKQKLKSHFQKKTEFNDYDFEASGLSNILDVLAYNTHVNGLTANYSLNEAFLTTAQLRSSVVSHAQTLGYEVQSSTAAKAIVNLSLNLTGVSGRPAQIALAKGTTFTSSIDGVSYTFRTRETFYALDNGSGVYNFKASDDTENISIFEGVEKIKTFLVGEKDERQVYVIPDATMDTSTAVVEVYETASSSTFLTYTPLSQAINVDANTTHFSIYESPNGFYELNFGDGISFGKSPEPGEKVVVTYLSNKGAAANNGTVFTPSSTITINSIAYPLNTVTVTESTGGAPKQTIESIRQLAPIAFAAQKRLVTSLDYKAMIETNFAQVKNAAVWSGDQNVPIDFGAIYISLNFETGTSDTVKQTVKDAIVGNYTNNLSVMSMTTKFSDPIDVFMEVNVAFQFDPALTGKTLGAMETDIYQFVQNYFATNVENFDAVFRKSNMLTEIDALDASILNSSVTIRPSLRQEVTINALNTFTLNYPVKIAVPDDVNHRVTSSTFEFKGVTATIKNRLSSTILEIQDLDGNVILDNVGEYNAQAGTVAINAFEPSQITTGQSFLIFTIVPEQDSVIKPLRNYILKLDTARSSATATVDRQTTSLEVSA
jgi:hypothetical protein